MKQEQLFPLIRHNLINILNGYIQTRLINEPNEEYIISPELEDFSGILGAVVMAING